jgi:HK97 family phage major capsid protein
MSSLHLRQERAAIVAQMSAALGSNHADKLARWKELDKKQEALRAQIESIEAADRVNRPNVGLTREQQDTRERFEAHISSTEYRNAFYKWAKTGDRSELRALGEGSATGGETLVPIGFQKMVETYMRAYGNWYDLARTVTTPTGNELQWPVEYDTASGTPQLGTWNAGTWLAENSANSETEPGFTNVLLYADKLDSGISKVSIELFQDSAFSMESLLSETFGRRIGFTKDNGLILGNGQRINGLIPDLTAAATSTKAAGNHVLATGANSNSGNSGDTDLNSIGTNDLGALIQAVDPAYRASKSCGFLANQATYDKLRTQLDKYGRPIWSVSVADQVPDQILGFPYRYSQNIAEIGAGNISMVFGDFSKYVIRDVLGLTMIRYNELFMQNYQIGFQAFVRTFGATLNPAAFSYLQHPLS